MDRWTMGYFDEKHTLLKVIVVFYSDLHYMERMDIYLFIMWCDGNWLDDRIHYATLIRVVFFAKFSHRKIHYRFKDSAGIRIASMCIKTHSIPLSSFDLNHLFIHIEIDPLYHVIITCANTFTHMQATDKLTFGALMCTYECHSYIFIGSKSVHKFINQYSVHPTFNSI